jgi:hypothetical protein
MYPQVIEEWRAMASSPVTAESNFGFCDGARISFGGMKGVLTRGIEIRQAQRNGWALVCLQDC